MHSNVRSHDSTVPITKGSGRYPVITHTVHNSTEWKFRRCGFYLCTNASANFQIGLFKGVTHVLYSLNLIRRTAGRELLRSLYNSVYMRRIRATAAPLCSTRPSSPTWIPTRQCTIDCTAL